MTIESEQPDTLSWSDAPSIPKVSFRAFRGVADVPRLFAVRQAAAIVDQVDPQSSREDLPTLSDMQYDFGGAAVDSPDILLAEVEENIVGYNRVQWWTEEQRGWVGLQLGWVTPDWRGHGIGSAFIHWAEQRLRAVADQRSPGGPAAYAANVSSTEPQKRQLFARHGYHEVRNLSDMAWHDNGPLVSMPLPPGVELRPVQPSHYRAVYAAYKDAWRGVFSATPETEADYQKFVAINVGADFDPSRWHVAWAGEEVVGFVLTSIRADVGAINEVGVRKAWQRRGIAYELMIAALRDLQTRGLSSIRLYTDAANGLGARGLYERVGFTEVKQHGLWRKPMR